MQKEISLNIGNSNVNCILENNNVKFEFEKGLTFLNSLIRVENQNDIILVYLGLKKIIRIEKGKVEPILSISENELKLICALYNNQKSNDLISEFKKIKDRISNDTYGNHRFYYKKLDKSKLKFSDSLINILSVDEFIDFLNSYNVSYPVDDNGVLNFERNDFLKYEIIKERKIVDGLKSSIELVNKENIENRKKLLNIVSNKLIEDSLNDKEWVSFDDKIKLKTNDLKFKMDSLNELKNEKGKDELKQINVEINDLNEEYNKIINIKSSYISSMVYDNLLNKCLEKLYNNNVYYSSIGSSNASRIKMICNNHTLDEKFNILYDIDAFKNMRDLKTLSKNIDELLAYNIVNGINFIFNSKIDSEKILYFKNDLEWLLPVLYINSRSVLRLDVLNVDDLYENIYVSLNIIKEVINTINEMCVDLFGEQLGIIPPPTIIISNANNIYKNKEIVQLVKEFNCILEINNSSDKENVLEYCDKNNINYEICINSKDLEKNNDDKVVKNKKIRSKKVKYSSYDEALTSENEIFNKNNIFNDIDKINYEINIIEQYIMDNKLDFDFRYFEKRIIEIRRLNKNIKNNDIAKIYLFLLEKETIPKYNSSFKSIEYLNSNSKKEDNDNKVESELIKLFNIIKKQYNETID